MAAFDVIWPPGEFRVETSGRPEPVGHAVKYPKVPCGTAVKFREYASAVPGTLQGVDPTGSERCAPPTSAGPPKGEGIRVSNTRHGAMGKKDKPMPLTGTK